jgi:protein-S-isoprenylcysteine O-methyltransferase Ste14
MIKKIGSLLIKRRTTITFLVVFLLFLEDFLEKRVPYSIFNFKDLWGPLGALMVLAGIFLRSWAAGVLHKTEILARVGPYAIVRHPLYMGSLWIALGFCIITGDIENIIGVVVLASIIYVPKKIYEEKKLATKFGVQWSAYTSDVPAFIPHKLPSMSAVRSGFSLDCWWHNREYEAAWVCLSFLIIMQLLNLFMRNQS